VAFSPDGTMLASAGAAKDVQLFDANTRKELEPFKGHTAWVRFCAFSPDGKTLASVGRDNTVRLWNVATRRQTAALKGHLRREGRIVAVGGTASNLLKILPAATLDRTLTRERIVEAEAILSSEPAAAAAERHVINPIRARILPAGGAIMDAILDRYGAERIRVSDAGLREGAILAVSHAGRAWRDRLGDLAHGWRT
jgi:hypothetical protein